MSEDVTDLDALLPKPRYIKFGGDQIEVKPPKTGDLLQLNALGKSLSEADKMETDKLEEALSKLTEKIGMFIPELKDKALTLAQMLKLVEIIMEMAVPPDVKELEKRGIKLGEPDADPKAPPQS